MSYSRNYSIELVLAYSVSDRVWLQPSLQPKATNGVCGQIANPTPIHYIFAKSFIIQMTLSSFSNRDIYDSNLSLSIVCIYILYWYAY